MPPSAPAASPPLGATVSAAGTTFALYSAHATAVDLCLFAGEADAVESRRVPARARPRRTCGTRRGRRRSRPALRLPGARSLGPRARPPLQPGQAPARSLRARAERAGRLAPRRSRAIPTVRSRAPPRTLPPTRATAPPCCPSAWWWTPPSTGVTTGRPRTPWDRTVIYECHVKGMTMLHPEVPEGLRGTYLGLCQRADRATPARAGRDRGGAAPDPSGGERAAPRPAGPGELLGVQLDRLLRARTCGSPRRATAPQVAEFKPMVRELHAAGLEVLLDVVYNHTAEGGSLGPTLAFRGIDNASYYRLDPDRPARYLDFTGCGNMLDLREGPRPGAGARQPALLGRARCTWTGSGSTSRRCSGGWTRSSIPRRPFFERVRQDPVLAGVKLIAEPWDLGPDGYQVGHFPAGWARVERQVTATRLRRFWRGDPGRSASWPHGWPAAATCTARRARSARQRQLRHLPRRLHAARSGELRAASTTRPTAKTTATAATTT